MNNYKHNILFLWDFEFQDAGGVGRVTETLAECFIKRGYKVYFLALTSGKNYSTRIGCHQFFLPCDDSIFSDKTIRFYKNFIKERDIDVVINQAGFSYPVTKFLHKAKLSKVNVFSVLHNGIGAIYENYPSIVYEGLKNKPLSSLLCLNFVKFILKHYHVKKFRNQLNLLINNSTKIILLSEKFIPELSIYLGDDFDRSKFNAIINPLPFNNSLVLKPDKSNRILYVGRVEYQQKRCDLLLDIWSLLFKQFPDWSFDIVGDGSALTEMKAISKARGYERIFFHGHQDPRPFYYNSKILCLTSDYEGFGMVLIEAQSFGVVPVSFNCFSGIVDIIQDKINGFLIPKGEINNFVKKLEVLMTNESQLNSMANTAMTTVKKYNVESICSNWENIIS